MQYSRQLAAHYPELVKLDTEVLVLGIGDIKAARTHAERIKAAFPVLADPQGSVYEKYMLERVFMDMIQQSASFVIDKKGMIQYAHRVTNFLEWLNLGLLNDALKTLNQS